MEWLTVAVLAMVVVAAMLFSRLRVQRSATVEVVADETGVRRVLADGRREAVAWHEVTEVEVFTTTIGPHGGGGGAVVLVGDAERGCIVPIGHLAGSHLLEHIHRLPGFDPATVVAAVGGSDEDRGPRGLLAPRPRHTTTVCWRRQLS